MARTSLTFFIPSLADVIFLCIFLSLALTPHNGLLNDADTGYHIRAGQWILENSSIPRHDIFSFLSPPPQWTAHEWLSEVVMALMHRFHGLTGVVLFFSLLISAEYYLLYKIVRTCNGDIISDILIVILALLSSQIHWLARPHIFSLLLMTIWYYLLEKYDRGNGNRLYLLPPLMILWVNLHGGFVVGLMLTGIFLVGNAVKSVCLSGPQREESRKRTVAFGIAMTSCLVACIANPQGPKILLFPFKLVSNTYIMDNVQEFLSPNFHEPVMFFKYLLLMMIVLISVSYRRVGLTELLLALAFTSMALYSARYIPLYAVVIAPIMSRQASSATGSASGGLADFLKKRSERVSAAEVSIKGGFWPLFAIMTIFVLVSAGIIKFGFDEKTKPVAAVEFLKSEKINGNMFNNDEFGDYIIYAAWPQYPVFFDGRSDMYGAERIREYFAVSKVRRDWQEVLARYDIDWIIFNSGSALATLLMENDDWKLIYADRVAEIFVKKKPEYASLIQKYPDVRPVHTDGEADR